MASNTKPKSRAKTPKLLAHLKWLRDELRVVDESWLELAIHEADPKLVVIVGDNASGKSFVVRAVESFVTRDGALSVSTSIRERAREGMQRVFMYGEERTQSTGATTTNWIISAFENNLARPNGCILSLDEPELGLSDGYARAMGELIGQRSRSVPRLCGGVMLVTHSRSLVRGLIEGAGVEPSFVVVGSSEPLTAAQ
jgi:predicted ATPase